MLHSISIDEASLFTFIPMGSKIRGESLFDKLDNSIIVERDRSIINIISIILFLRVV